MAEQLDPRDLRPVIDPRWLWESGVTIPAPTPTGINIQNPWKPAGDGSDGNKRDD